jgi:hypothetical protein
MDVYPCTPISADNLPWMGYYSRNIGYVMCNETDIGAAYIILGVALIGRQLENPFGTDVTDIDMDLFIRQLKVELNILTSKPPPTAQDFIATDQNYPLGPKSPLPYSAVKELSVDGTTVFFLANEKSEHI